jgi:hypothetical protein
MRGRSRQGGVKKGRGGIPCRNRMSTKNEAENILKTKVVKRQIGKNEAENILRNKIVS